MSKKNQSDKFTRILRNYDCFKRLTTLKASTDMKKNNGIKIDNL